MDNLVREILKTATVDTLFKPFPLGNRFNTRTGIWLCDEVPGDLLVEEEVELDFWNEVSGWFHSNNNHKVYDSRKETNFEIPEDVCIEPSKPCIGSWEAHVVGDRIVTADYKVYKVYGFVKPNGGLDIYYNIA